MEETQAGLSTQAVAAVRRMMGRLRLRARQRVDPRLLGFVDYYRHASVRDIWGGSFNGQAFRRRMFRDLVAAGRPTLIVETGTFRGVTTQFMARESGLPVFTVEHDAHSYGFAAARLLRERSVQRVHGDSIAALRRWLPSWPADAVVLAYLDAHWGERLPARDEVRCIFQHCPGSIIMIDDFQVPDDAGYGFDDYGTSGVLAPEYLQQEIQDFRLRTFYPSCPSRDETGARRGCVVLASGARADALAALPCLREAC